MVWITLLYIYIYIYIYIGLKKKRGGSWPLRPQRDSGTAPRANRYKVNNEGALFKPLNALGISMAIRNTTIF